MNKANMPRRKRQKQEEAMERMGKNLFELDGVIRSNPTADNIDILKERRGRLVETIENTKKNLR